MCRHIRDYQTARAVLAHPELDRTAGLAHSGNPLVAHVLNQNGDVHRRLRAWLAAAVDAALPRVAATTRRAADALLGRCAGALDVAGSVVRPLALLVVDDLVGMSGGDSDELRWWHRAALATDAGATPQTIRAIEVRLRAKIADRRREPRDDMLSHVAAEEIGDRELIASLYFAFSAGYVNLANFFGLALLALARNPEEYAALRAQRDAVPTAVDELLRYAEPQARASLRFTGRAVQVAGHRLDARSTVRVFRAAANRDPARFGNPQQLDLRRPDARASLAFGAGPHYCLGAELVRTAADIWLLSLLEHVAALRPTAQTARDWDFAAPLWLALHPANRASRTWNESFARHERLTGSRTESGGAP